MDRNLQAHLRQWTHNRKFLESIQPDYPDWIVTVAFYVALHAIDAILVHDKVPGIISHAARNDVLMRTNRYEKIFRAYQPLYALSQTVRYLADPSKWVLAEEIEGNVLRRYLYPIEASVFNLLKIEGCAEPIAMATKCAAVTEKPASDC